MEIGKKDIYWNYAATFLKIAASVLLMPLILKKLPSEEVGIWSVFITITAFSNLLDFGFSPSFTRNVSYIFSGVKSLKATGYEIVTSDTVGKVDFGLLKGTITAMRWLYLRMSIVLLVILSTLGSFYIYSLLNNYKGNHNEVYIAWTLLCIINTYNLYTLYYDSLLQGKGLIKRSKQIIIIGQTSYILVAAVMILMGYGLIAIVSAQLVSVVIIRWLSYKSFFNRETKSALNSVESRPWKEIISAISPNAIKIGLTTLGSFIIQKSSIIIGSLYLSLNEIGSYGITTQLISVIAVLAVIYPMTFQPKIAQLRIENKTKAIKSLYIKGQILLLVTFLFCGFVFIFAGDWTLHLIHSQTELLPPLMIFVATVISFLENNHAIAGNILLSKNEVPFFKASLLSGAFNIILLFLFFRFTTLNIWAMILAPGIAQGVYQNWKWPYEVMKDIQITRKDVYRSIKEIAIKRN